MKLKDIQNFSMSLETACVIEKLQIAHKNMIKRFATLDEEKYLNDLVAEDENPPKKRLCSSCFDYGVWTTKIDCSCIGSVCRVHCPECINTECKFCGWPGIKKIK